MWALLLFLVLFMVLAYRRSPARIWTIAIGVYLGIVTLFYYSAFMTWIVWPAFVVFALLLNVTLVRKILFIKPVFKLFTSALPKMSNTEKEALDAGTVWWDGDLFSGSPDWGKLLRHKTAQLNTEEQAFVDGPTNELCSMISDWEISELRNDLPPEVWQFIKEQKFLGMIIPKEYGGLGFSALAHSAVIMKISTRSVASAVSVMVPNSLGPAELLLRYGTDKQKDHYLPRLADGRDIPCFALTSPEAGSDASSIPDFGIVCRQDYEGKTNVLGIKLTWDKRYITLGPVATLLGLAFQLRDPDALLGDKKDLGITCALIPTSHEGVNIGRRHHPSGIGFQNGPNSGDEVFIPIDWIIGGQEQAGQGWRMLMECLAAGRSISLPALSVGGVKFTSHTIGAYARVRKQFKTPIAYFEGIEEPLARMAGYTYMMDSARILTASALDHGESPSVLSAILKYNLTEQMRQAVNDAMDIQGGAAICLGPNNILGKLYHAIPISITVEGANILTRTLIVFGQGAIRCHPYVFNEMKAAQNANKAEGVEQFDQSFSAHINFILSNFSRTFVLGITHAKFVEVPGNIKLARYYQHLTRFSSAFSLMADVTMLTIGGGLKRKEKLSGRFADILSMLYLASASLKRFEDDGCPEEDLVLVQWTMEETLYRMQTAMTEILQNFPLPYVGKFFKLIVFPLGQRFKKPSDVLGHEVAGTLISPSKTRSRLTDGIYIPTDEDDQVARLEEAFGMAQEADKIEKRLFALKKQGKIDGIDVENLLQDADLKTLVPDQDVKFYARYLTLRKAIIKVDDFAPDEFNLLK